MHSLPILLFDVMDTLVYNPFNHEIPAFFGLSQALLLEQKSPLAWEQFELGKISEQDYYDGYFRDRRKFDHQEFRRVVRDAYRWIDPDTVGLLDRLRASGFTIHAFSNYPIWYETIDARLGLSEFLDWTFVSCRTGVRKPCKDAYVGVTQYFARPPDAFLFVDDSIVNCKAARAIGMPAIHYRDLSTLRIELAQHGVLAE
ncbi:MAG: HAD-IA family hydrolase [Planctomycetales bacterium]|nr:HAD-IA family hydrolase [Planctomycetales bacterium]